MIVAAITIETPEAISAYSIAVAPRSSLTKRRNVVHVAPVENYSMAFCLLAFTS